MMELNGKEYNICNADQLTTEGKDSNPIVEATYEIRYQGNFKFEKPNRKSVISLDRYKELHEVNAICNVK